MLFPSSVTTSRRKSLQRPESWFPLSPGLPAVTQVPAGANRGRQKPKAVGVWKARRGWGGVQKERSVCREARAGLPARASCSSAASLPAWPEWTVPLQAVPCTQAWPSCSPSGSSGLVSSQQRGDQYGHKPSVESLPWERPWLPGTLRWKGLAKVPRRFRVRSSPWQGGKKRTLV